MAATTEYAVSSPGKVLIIGGYLVLQEGTPGLVVSTTARFHSTISLHPRSPEHAAPTSQALDFVVASPQFHRDWRFRLEAHVATGSLRIVPAEASGGGNVFVEHAVNTALVAAVGVLGFDVAAARFGVGAASEVRLLLQADNDFYSQRAHLVAKGLPVSSASLASLPPFLPCPVDAATGKAQVSKTGLGSSAALTTSVASAVLLCAGAVQLDSPAGAEPSPREALPAPASRALIHTVAQVAHGLAQGKVGSGFDVCSAAYGSIEYTRVPPSSLGEAMGRVEAALSAVAEAAAAPSAAADGAADARDKFAAAGKLLTALARRESGLLQATASSLAADAAAVSAAGPAGEVDSLIARWNVGVRPFGLPQGLRLLLADVAGGSETPSMVRQVLAWREGKTAPACGAPGSEPLVRSLTALDCGCSVEEIQACFLAAVVAAADASGLPAGGAHPHLEAAQQTAMLAAASSSTGPALWKASAAANARAAVVVEQLHVLARSQPAPYSEAIRLASTVCWHDEAPLALAAGQASAVAQVLSKLAELVQAFAHCRHILRCVMTGVLGLLCCVGACVQLMSSQKSRCCRNSHLNCLTTTALCFSFGAAGQLAWRLASPSSQVSSKLSQTPPALCQGCWPLVSLVPGATMPCSVFSQKQTLLMAALLVRVPQRGRRALHAPAWMAAFGPLLSHCGFVGLEGASHPCCSPTARHLENLGRACFLSANTRPPEWGLS